MLWDFSHKEYLVLPEAWEQRRGRRIMWIGVITLVHHGRSHTIALDNEFFDWPRNARDYAAKRAREMIDAYVRGARGCVDPMELGSPARRPVPDYPAGPFSDTVTRF